MGIENHPNYGVLTNAITTLIDKIRGRQDIYYSGNNRFFQGLRTPTANCDGITDQAIDPYLHPSDVQSDSWYDFDSFTFKSSTKISFNISISIYHGPFGDGWFLIIEIWYPGLGPDIFGNSGNHWIYKHHEGAEQWYGIWNVWHIIPDTGRPL